MLILYAQLLTNIPLHCHVFDGFQCLNLTKLFIFVLIMIALTEIIGDIKHSLIPFVCVLSDIFLL